jgi:hypothetical protein
MDTADFQSDAHSILFQTLPPCQTPSPLHTNTAKLFFPRSLKPVPEIIKLPQRLGRDPLPQLDALNTSKGEVNLPHTNSSQLSLLSSRSTIIINLDTHQGKGIHTPPNTRLLEFSSAAAFKLVNVRVMTPRLSSVTVLLSVALMSSELPFHARSTAAAAPPNVECVET